MNINWYHSKHCKQRIFITSSKYGFYIPADLIFDVEIEFKLNSCDVGLTDNGDMVLRFLKLCIRMAMQQKYIVCRF